MRWEPFYYFYANVILRDFFYKVVQIELKFVENKSIAIERVLLKILLDIIKIGSLIMAEPRII